MHLKREPGLEPLLSMDFWGVHVGLFQGIGPFVVSWAQVFNGQHSCVCSFFSPQRSSFACQERNGGVSFLGLWVMAPYGILTCWTTLLNIDRGIYSVLVRKTTAPLCHDHCPALTAAHHSSPHQSCRLPVIDTSPTEAWRARASSQPWPLAERALRPDRP